MTLDSLLDEIQAALTIATPLAGAAGVPEVDLQIANSLERIVVAGLRALQQQSGQPYDLSKLPDEGLV